MTTRLAALFSILVLFSAPMALAGSKPNSKLAVSFHIETDQNEDPKMVFSQIDNGKTRYFRRMPEATSNDIVAFSPFPAEGTDGYGMVFKLKENVAHRFAAVSNMNQGRWLVAQMNGRVVDAVIIDKGINDGLLVIWKGATLNDVQLFDAAMPRIGREGQKKKK